MCRPGDPAISVGEIVRRGRSKVSSTRPIGWLPAPARLRPKPAAPSITAEAVAKCSETERAWRNGEISLAQANEIAKSEKVRPGSDAHLLEIARRSPLRVLKEE